MFSWKLLVLVDKLLLCDSSIVGRKSGVQLHIFHYHNMQEIDRLNMKLKPTEVN